MEELARIELDGDATLGVVRLSGEIDISNAAAAEERLIELCGSLPEVVLDLRELSFLDSSGVHMLFRLHKALPGSARIVIGEASPLRRVLDLVGVERLMPVETVPEDTPEHEPPTRAQRLPGEEPRLTTT